MACTPFPAPDQDLFINTDQGIWSHVNESKGAGAGARSVTYSSGNLTATGPHGSTTFLAVASGNLRHKFFGNGNFLAVASVDGSSGPVGWSVSIVDFTASPTKSKQVWLLGGDAASPPWLQYAKGSGSVCLVGLPTLSGVAGLQIVRSDTGDFVCAG